MSQAKWIWKKGEHEKNTWLCFTKDIFCEQEPENVMARIAVDSKYWLYINGRMVVFEGGLKRGQNPQSVYYDEVDLSGCFRQGKNRIAVLVWYFGKHGFSHVSSGLGGFWFDMEIGANRVVSDGSWKIKKNEAYIQAPLDETGPNFRLPESDLYFDASKQIKNWYRENCSIETWDFADVYDMAEQDRFGTLVKREIPLFRDYGIKDFVNSDEVKGKVIREDTVLEMRLPYNLQFTPVLIVEAQEGKMITIRAENYYTNAPGENGLKSVYITGNGYQEYEAFGWLNGERIQFEIPAGMTIHNLRYRQTGYDTDQIGSFRCDDEFLNRLWEKCYRTLYISMRDTFMDCPDRERTQWWGDVNIEMQMLLYCMDERAFALYEKGVNSLIGWYEATGNMWTVVPSGREQFELPLQNLAGICGFYRYFFHTGKKELLKKVYPMSKYYLQQYKIEKNGLVCHRSGSWDWPDWGEHADLVVLENAWFYLALESCRKMAEVLGYSEDMQEYQIRMDLIQQSLRQKINEAGVFYGNTDNNVPDDRANAVAILAGLAEEKQTDALVKLFETVENASPYMEKYVLDALCEMRRIDNAVSRLKKRYRDMVEDEYSTLWELWNKESSLNHAWTGGPLLTMSKYIAGIHVEEAGGVTYRICPHLGTLKQVECCVPTRCGILKVQASKDAGKYQIYVVYPKGINIITEIPDDALGNTEIKLLETEKEEEGENRKRR